jgi:Subtilase family
VWVFVNLKSNVAWLIPNNAIYYYMTTAIKIGVTFLIFFVLGGPIMAQTDAWFYLRARDTLFEPSFKKNNDEIRYTGHDSVLHEVFSKHKILVFKKTYRNANRENLKKTFFVIAENESLLNDLLLNASHLFEFGELIMEEDKKIFEPNDYGLTSTIGENIGIQVNLDYLDFLGLPKAWYYTVGSKDVFVGISDGEVDSTNIDFKDKITMFKRSSKARGHGSGIASIAVGQGNNGYGIPGLCYDCMMYTTNYGDFQKLRQLQELSDAGVRVINCSWVGPRYFESAQSVIDKMFNNGTIIVAAAGNRNWIKTKGKQFYYPASYDHVISVSSVMYRYENPEDNILYEENGNPYAQNIRGYLGETAGFKNHDVTQGIKSIYSASVSTLNSEVDLLAPTVGVFRFSKFVTDLEEMETTFRATSTATPFVTGTIGLMYSLNPCLPVDEVESILKMTSMNIDHIEVNKPYIGKYGAGILQTGDAVEMVYNLYTETEIVHIQDQQFSRWDFKITSLSKEIRIRNQKFTDKATLKLTAKNRIVIGKNTVLRPNEQGSISLKIDPALEKQCDLVLRDPSIEE